MKIAVYGAGGVGGYFAGRVALAGADVHLIARDVGIAEGVPLPPNFVDGLLVFAEQVDPGGYSSLHFDMTHGRRMGLEGLHGTLVRLASKHGIPVSRCETIYSILKPWEARNEVRVSTAT